MDLQYSEDNLWYIDVFLFLQNLTKDAIDRVKNTNVFA
jgi:hypothetical protein